MILSLLKIKVGLTDIKEIIPIHVARPIAVIIFEQLQNFSFFNVETKRFHSHLFEENMKTAIKY